MAQQGATLQNYNNELVKCEFNAHTKINLQCLHSHIQPAPAIFKRIHIDALTVSLLIAPGIEDLREKREEVNRQILKEEEEKAKIQKDLSILTDRLSKINESLARKVQARNEYDKTIQETEAAYMKILESSQTLLHVLKRETVNLTKKKQSSS